MPCKMAKHAGFCMGVRHAVELALQAAQEAKARGIRCFSLGDVVHNPSVAQRLRDAGVQKVDEVSQAQGGLLILRSHGVAPGVMAQCERLGVECVDCTCAHVRALHEAVARFSQAGGDVVLVGEREHPEVQGTAGWCRGAVYVVFSPEDVAAMPHLSEALVVSQTTIPEEKWDELTPLLKEKIDHPVFHRSICAATRVRQQAARELSRISDRMIVVGGRQSANTRKLYEACAALCPAVSYTHLTLPTKA